MIHLVSALIDDLVNSRLLGPCVRLVLADALVHFVGELVALLEALVVCADEHDAEVVDAERDVNVEHEFLGAARDAHRRPSLPIRHRGQRHDKVENQLDVCD